MSYSEHARGQADFAHGYGDAIPRARGKLQETHAVGEGASMSGDFDGIGFSKEERFGKRP